MNQKTFLYISTLWAISIVASCSISAQVISSSPSPEAYTKDTLLIEYLSELYRSAPRLQAIEASYRAKETQRNLHLSSFLSEPVLSLGYIPWKVGMPPLQVGVSQKLPWPGQKTKLKKQLSGQSKQEALKLHVEYKEAAVQMLKKLYSLYEATKIAELLERQLQILTQEEAIITKEAQHSSASGLELLRLQAQIEEIEEQRSDILERTDLLSTQIGLQLGQHAAQITAPDTLYLPSLNKDSLLHWLPLRNTQLRAKKQDELTHRAAISYKRSLRYPSPQLHLRYMTYEMRQSTELQAPETLNGGLFVTASMRLPILTHRHRLRDLLAEQHLKVSQLETRQLETQLFTEFEEKWRIYERSKRKIELYNRLIEKNKITAAVLSSSATSTSIPYLNTQLNHLRYQTKRTKALGQAIEASLILQSFVL